MKTSGKFWGLGCRWTRFPVEWSFGFRICRVSMGWKVGDFHQPYPKWWFRNGCFFRPGNRNRFCRKLVAQKNVMHLMQKIWNGPRVKSSFWGACLEICKTPQSRFLRVWWSYKASRNVGVLEVYISSRCTVLKRGSFVLQHCGCLFRRATWKPVVKQTCLTWNRINGLKRRIPENQKPTTSRNTPWIFW